MKLPDTNQFFIDIALRVCSNLEIEKGLYECFQYLRKYMPGDAIYLERYEPDFSAIRIIAHATNEGFNKMDTLVTLDKESMQQMKAMDKAGFPQYFLSNCSDDSPISRNMLQLLGEPSSSILSTMLMVDDQLMGALTLVAYGRDRFTEDHVELYQVVRKPFFLAMSNAMEHLEVLKLQKMLTDENQFLRGELRRVCREEVIGAHFGLREVMLQVTQVAHLDSPVLLSGETGAGKDVIANVIHCSSSRSKGPMISVNCGAIPESLIDSELFGHEKGAFTGAIAQKKGRFERADKGTIFLDEIGELPLEAQVRLLRVLQSHEIERVGGTKMVPVDIRIIAASNQNLEELVKEGKFREDLWFRLNVFPILIPPLRERKADIPALLQHFINTKSKELKLPAIPKMATSAIDELIDYNWPGNVRELQNIVERALILNPKGSLSFSHLLYPGKSRIRPNGKTDNLDQIISSHIRNVLNKTSGKIHGAGGAAALLGVNPNTLRNRMNKLGIAYGRKNH
ncbi:MAG: sigma 54-interacting transcriptional regulator [Cyclobacteriaceae bacterium]